MNLPSIPLLIGLLSVVLSCASAGQARATLGEPAASVESDSTALSAVRRSATSRTGYTVQEIVSDAATIREYVSPGGIVFGIAWNGLTHPDLGPLLGAYHAEYRQARQQTPRQHGRRFLHLKSAHIVVEKWGHMRDLRGRAFVPSLVPPGVSTDEIK
jgi:hypothetical protein